jgi:hypothetical protein
MINIPCHAPSPTEVTWHFGSICTIFLLGPSSRIAFRCEGLLITLKTNFFIFFTSLIERPEILKPEEDISNKDEEFLRAPLISQFLFIFIEYQSSEITNMCNFANSVNKSHHIILFLEAHDLFSLLARWSREN